MNDELDAKSNIVKEQKYELDCKERDLRALLDANIKFANQLNGLKDELAKVKNSESESKAALNEALSSPRVLQTHSDFVFCLPSNLTPNKRTRKSEKSGGDQSDDENSESCSTSVTMNISSETADDGNNAKQYPTAAV